MKLNLKSCLSILPVVALLGAAACGGSNNQNQQPMTPAAGSSPGMAGSDSTSTTTTPGSTTQGAPTDSTMSGGNSTQGGVNAGTGANGSSMNGSSGMPSSGQSGQSGMAGSGQSGMGTSGSAGMGGSGADQGSLNDAQIAQILDTLNRGEEKEAQLAVGKAKDAKVKQFANMMLTGHRDANRKLMADVKKANITPSQSSTSTQLDNDAMQTTDAIRSKTGADFDKQYIDDQVKMHTQALDLIDNRLMPNAKDATLKADLQTMRATVADHLRRAQDLQANMSGGGTSGASGSGSSGSGSSSGSMNTNGSGSSGSSGSSNSGNGTPKQ